MCEAMLIVFDAVHSIIMKVLPRSEIGRVCEHDAVIDETVRETTVSHCGQNPCKSNDNWRWCLMDRRYAASPIDAYRIR